MDFPGTGGAARILDDAPFLDPGDPVFLADPHPVFDHLRRAASVVRDPIGWSTVDYAASTAAFKDAALVPGIDPLLESRGIEPLWGEAGRTLTDSEGADHQRLRRAIGPYFNPGRVEGLRDRVRTLVETILVDIGSADDFDLMSDLADVVPARLFCWMVGAPESDSAELTRLSKTLLTVFTATDRMVAPVRAAKVAMADFTRELIAAKRRSPGDDVVSLLIDACTIGVIDEIDLFHLIEELLSASVDNTANTAGLAVWTLLHHPDQLRRIHDSPDLAARAAEECGRYEPAIRHTIKFATAETTLDGTPVERGDFVTIRIAAAHRDPAIFDDPHRFDIAREHPRPQLAFGTGRHFCLGAALGRMEVAEIVRAIAIRHPDATLGQGVSMSLNEAGLVHALPIHLGDPA